MKRLICTLTACLLSLLLATSAGAVQTEDPKDYTVAPIDPNVNSKMTEDGKYIGIYDLFQYWEHAEYPDYVCGVWSTNGGNEYLTVGVTEDEAGEEGMKEIRDMILRDETVNFVYQKHSHNELIDAIKETLTSDLRSHGLIGAMLYEQENLVQVVFHREYEEDKRTRRSIAEIEKLLGDAVRITFTDLPEAYGAQTFDGTLFFPCDTYDYLYNDNQSPDITPDDDGLVTAYGEKALDGWLFLAACLLLLLALTLLIKRRLPLLQASTGGTVTASVLGTKQTETLVREATPDVPSALDDKVYSAIDAMRDAQ